MPVQPQVKWPGVYIQEVESNVRTIVPVATADTAFVGRARKGPVDTPVICHNFADFEKTFGGLWEGSLLGHAVSDFFSNGGTTAIVVRVFKASSSGGGGDDESSGPPRATFKLKNNVVLEAASPGAWAKNLTIKVTQEDAEIRGELAKQLQISDEQPVSAADVYNVAVYESGPDPVETFNAVTFTNSVRSAVRVLEQSNLVRVKVNGATAVTTAGDGDGADVAEASPTAASIAALKARADAAKATADPLVARARQLQADYNVKVAQREQAKTAWETAKDKDKEATRKALSDADTVVGKAEGALKAAQEEAAKASSVADVEKAAYDAGVRRAKSGATVVPAPMSGEETALLDTAHPFDDGEPLDADDLVGSEANRTGMYALDTAGFNLLVFPDYVNDATTGPSSTLLGAAGDYCAKRRAFLLLDSPAEWDSKSPADLVSSYKKQVAGPAGAGGTNAAFYYPRIRKANPLHDGQIESFSPLGAIAGVYARTDATRGVWKAPAGLDAALGGVVGLTADLTDAQNGELNPLGINCLRRMPSGNVIWGARTLKGDDRLANQWKYVPVRRTALYIEESLYQGTQWAVFEPNDEPLWSTLRLNIGAFMHGLFRQGAFQGGSPKDAYFVQCDASTTTQADIDRGIVNLIVGFAPLKPAEFVIIYIQQKANMPAA
jgi:hypothetical protein